MSENTDSYQPIERKLKITRGCLEVLLKYRNPVTIVTKNHLVTRDLVLLSELARYRAAAVTVSITTLDNRLASQDGTANNDTTVTPRCGRQIGCRKSARKYQYSAGNFRSER